MNVWNARDVQNVLEDRADPRRGTKVRTETCSGQVEELKTLGSGMERGTNAQWPIRRSESGGRTPGGTSVAHFKGPVWSPVQNASESSGEMRPGQGPSDSASERRC